MNELVFQGYPRKNGEVGIRNYILVVSMVHCANAVAQRIAHASGAVCITHDYGCIESADAHEGTFRALVQTACNPNVYAALLVGLGCEQTDHEAMLAQIAKTGKPAAYIGIQELGGVRAAVQKGLELAWKFQHEAAKLMREPFLLSKLVLGVQCGGSDWTTALTGNSTIGAMTDRLVAAGGSVLISEVGGFPGSEHILAQRARTIPVGLQVLKMCDELRSDFYALHGQSIEAVNPSPGNKAGGITTLVEKSMGNVKKMGQTATLQGLIRGGERIPSSGLWLLDMRVSGPDANTTSGFAMSGAHMTVFSTGRGTPLGNAVMPVLKLTGNPECFAAMQDIFDFNAGIVMDGISIEKAGQMLLETVIDVASGTPCQAERN